MVITARRYGSGPLSASCDSASPAEHRHELLPAVASSAGDRVEGRQMTTPAQVETDFFRMVRPSSLLQRFATTDEVAAMVAFVASPLSSGTNGAALRVEGGVVRSIL